MEVEACENCGHPADHPDALQRVMVGDCLGCAVCEEEASDADQDRG